MIGHRQGAGRALRIAAVAGLLGAAGCRKPDAGPKRPDHTLAHQPRFHPDVRRHDAPGVDAAPPTTAPGEGPAMPAGMLIGSGPVGRPVLFVNGDPIAVQEVLEPIIEDLRAKAARLGLEDYRDALWRTVNRQIRDEVSAVVVYQEAKKAYSDKMQEMFDKKADEIIRNIIQERFGGVHARYEEHLRSLDLTPEQAHSRAKRQAMVFNFLHERFRPKLQEPSRRELSKYYQQHLDEFTTPARAEMLLIEIPLSEELGKPMAKAAPAEIAAARERARARLQEARQKLDGRVDFALVAKEYSKGLNAQRGGAWGEVSPGSLRGRWAKPAEVLFTLEPEQVSDVLETPESVFIVKCGRRSPMHRLSFEEAQEKIIARMLDESFDELSREYVQKLLSRATINPNEHLEFVLAVVAASPRPAGSEPPPASRPVTTAGP